VDTYGARAGQVRALKRAVARHVRVHHRPGALRTQPAREICDGNAGRRTDSHRAPARDQLPMARIDPDGELVDAVARQQAVHEPSIGGGHRAQHDARGTPRQELVDRCLRRDAAPHLHAQASRPQAGAGQVVVGAAAVRAIEVDEMGPARPGARVALEDCERVGSGGRGARHAPALHVNGGVELHDCGGS